MGFLNAFGDWYDGLMSAYTVPTIVVTSMIIVFLGDVATQLIVRKKDTQFSFLQSLKMMVWGAEYGFFYHYILELLSLIHLANSIVSMLVKVLIDQLIVAVIINTLFYTTVSLLQDCDHPFRRAWGIIRANLLSTMKVNWCIWPIVQMVNFFFVPVDYQTLVCNCVSFFWSMFLSFMAFQKEKKELKAKTPAEISTKDPERQEPAPIDMPMDSAQPNPPQESPSTLSL